MVCGALPVAVMTSLPSLVVTSPLKRPWVESYLNMYTWRSINRLINQSNTNHVVKIDKRIVDGDNLDRVFLDGGAEHQTSDAAETVDSNCWLAHFE